MKGWSHAKWWSKRMIMVDGDDQKIIKCFTFGKEEREKQKPRRSRQRYNIGFCFGI
jgi:hypothetical protein